MSLIYTRMIQNIESHSNKLAIATIPATNSGSVAADETRLDASLDRSSDVNTSWKPMSELL